MFRGRARFHVRLRSGQAGRRRRDRLRRKRRRTLASTAIQDSPCRRFSCIPNRMDLRTFDPETSPTRRSSIADYLAAEADRHAIHQDRRALRGAHINGKRLAMSGLDRPVGAFLPAQWPCIGQLRRLTPRQRLTYRLPANVDGKQYRKSSKSSREYRGRYGPRHPELDPLGRRKARTPWPIAKSRHPRLLSSNRQENHS